MAENVYATMLTNSIGTGTIVLVPIAGEPTLAMAGISTGSTVTYRIVDNLGEEVAYGIYTLSGLTLTRGTLIRGSRLNLDGNTIVQFITITEDNLLEVLDGDGKALVEFQSDGHMQFNGTAKVWNDLRVPALSTKLGGSKDPGLAKVQDNGSGSQGVLTYVFDASTEEELYFMAQFPHGWDGSIIYPHVHWTPMVTADGTPANQTVEWGLEYTWANVGESFPTTEFVYGKAHTPADADVVAKDHYITPLTAITPLSTQSGLSSMLLARIFRNATDATDDTYEADAAFLEIDFHYQSDSLGSNNQYSD